MTKLLLSIAAIILFLAGGVMSAPATGQQQVRTTRVMSAALEHGTPDERKLSQPPVPSRPEGIPDDDDRVVMQTSQIPGFAGTYIRKDGTFVVRSTTPTRARSPFLRSQLGKQVMARAVSERQIVVRDARFSFTRLNGWKDAIRDDMHRVPGLVFLDLDDRANRLTIGVENRRRALAPARKMAQDHAVPPSAVVVVEADAAVQDAGLRQTVRPLRGGLETYSAVGPNFNHSKICSLGVAVRRRVSPADNRDFILTNSHCAGVQGGDQDTEFYQNGDFLDNLFGIEFKDPAYTTADCPDNRHCRLSDAALVRVYNTIPDSAVSTGGVAATESRTRAGGGVASRTIVGTYDLYDLMNTAVQDGQEVDKVGRTSGHTFGFITKRCVDYNVLNTNKYLWCQYEGTYNSDPGDSGAVVWDPIYQYIYGINWGHVEGTNRGIYSPTSGIERELGSLTTYLID